MVYIAFYTHKKRIRSWRGLWQRLADFIVRLVTRSRYSHCEVAIPRGSDLYDCYSASFRDGGVRKKTMVLSPERWDLVPVITTPNRVRRVFNRCAGKKYDWLGVFGFAFHKQQSQKFYCSEFCAEVLNLKDTHQSPQSLYHLITKRN